MDTQAENSEHGPASELQQLGQEILRGGITIAKFLEDNIPYQGEVIEVGTISHRNGKATVSNGSEVGFLNISNLENLTGGKWKVNIFQPGGNLKTALEKSVPGAEMFVSMPLTITVQLTTTDSNGVGLPFRIIVTEDPKYFQWAASIRQDDMNNRPTKEAEIDKASQAAELVRSVATLVQNNPIETAKSQMNTS